MAAEFSEEVVVEAIAIIKKQPNDDRARTAIAERWSLGEEESAALLEHARRQNIVYRRRLSLIALGGALVMQVILLILAFVSEDGQFIEGGGSEWFYVGGMAISLFNLGYSTKVRSEIAETFGAVLPWIVGGVIVTVATAITLVVRIS